MVRSREHRDMVCPGARWIGIHPSEFSALGMSPIALTRADISRIRSLEGRSYCDEKLSEELKILKKGKVEIEALASLSYRFLTMVYLPRKINANEYL
ncbi:meiotic recombination protein W68-like [Athalia rosae]|uniref:meiotic recombination protein W68-like n=1 Tax=Athalia rosae TaxID=37344 RepID=UPI0020349A76|nr:meiotic recombination protein W68-like [Athalia rosae]